MRVFTFWENKNLELYDFPFLHVLHIEYLGFLFITPQASKIVKTGVKIGLHSVPLACCKMRLNRTDYGWDRKQLRPRVTGGVAR